jgi:hypothetical protein
MLFNVAVFEYRYRRGIEETQREFAEFAVDGALNRFMVNGLGLRQRCVHAGADLGQHQVTLLYCG